MFLAFDLNALVNYVRISKLCFFYRNFFILVPLCSSKFCSTVACFCFLLKVSPIKLLNLLLLLMSKSKFINKKDNLFPWEKRGKNQQENMSLNPTKESWSFFCYISLPFSRLSKIRLQSTFFIPPETNVL